MITYSLPSSSSWPRIIPILIVSASSAMMVCKREEIIFFLFFYFFTSSMDLTACSFDNSCRELIEMELKQERS
jgi:hypothetical protein